MVSEYKILNNEVGTANKVKSGLIECLQQDPNDQVVVAMLFQAQNEYNDKFEIANNYYQKIKEERQNAKIFFFPNNEKFTYNLGIAIFVLYLGLSFLMFLKNKNSTNRLYQNAIKIKSFIILIAGIYFVAYILLPSEKDFENIVYYLSIGLVSILSLYGAISTIKYILSLESEVQIANKNIVRFIRLIGKLKRVYIYPLAMRNKNLQNDLLVKNNDFEGNNLENLDTDIKEVLEKIA